MPCQIIMPLLTNRKALNPTQESVKDFCQSTKVCRSYLEHNVVYKPRKSIWVGEVKQTGNDVINSL